MTADEIRGWDTGARPEQTNQVLQEIAAQLAEQNECSHAIIALWGDAKKRDEANIARVAKLDEDLQKARIATEEIAQKYWQLAAETEKAKADLWKPRSTEGAAQRKEGK